MVESSFWTARRLRILLALALLLGALLTLAGGLPRLEFDRGAYLLPEESEASPAEMGVRDAMLSDLRPGLLALVARLVFWGLVPLAFVVWFFRPGSKRRRLVMMLLTIASVIAVALFMRQAMAEITEFEPPPALALTPLPTPAGATLVPRPEYAPPPPSLAGWLSLGVAGLLVAAGLALWRRIRPADDALDRLAGDAQAALADLRGGGEFDDVILRCYLQMARTLEEERGIQRGQSLTPREFALQLQERGLPPEAVANLTTLFEQARYGRRQATPADERTAVESLEAIVAHFGERAR